jgi:hypothetical protein
MSFFLNFNFSLWKTKDAYQPFKNIQFILKIKQKYIQFNFLNKQYNSVNHWKF